MTIDLFDLPPLPASVAAVHRRMEANAETTLATWRRHLKDLSFRLGRPVSTDDLWVSIDNGLTAPIPSGTSPNILGGVFRGGDWRAVGFTRSKRPEANGNRLTTWLPK